MSSNKHLCTNLPQCNWKLFLMPQPNKTKPPLQVLAVVEGNSEKIRLEVQTHDVRIYWLKHKIIYLYITSLFSHFLSTAGLESDPASKDYCLLHVTHPIPFSDIVFEFIFKLV